MARIVRIVLSLCCFMTAFSSLAAAQDVPEAICRVTVYDKSVELEDSRIAVDLSRSRVDAYEKIFKMIEGLWEGKAIPRMDYIKAKYDLDAARLELEQNGFIVERQAALVEQYRLICNGQAPGGENLKDALWKAYVRYRKAECDSLSKGIEVASTNLEYDREYLTNIQKLREENFATNTQVILAQLDVDLEEKSMADAQQRSSACRAELESIEKNTASLFREPQKKSIIK
jgi:hypothetical protein